MQDFTDSYCERCGTRYTFGPPPPKGRSIATARVLARGLKHFVMNDSSTIDDAMAAARTEEERTSAAQVTEEFHKVFNFCMTCRQYACEKCWNPNQSACLSCAPLWDQEPVAPEGHLIIRTPTARQPASQEPAVTAPGPDLDDLLRQRSADLARDAGRRTPGEVRREARRDQKAADQLRAQSESWKTQEDGWSLWPSEQPPAGPPPVPSPLSDEQPAAMSLTADELLLVQAELDAPPYQEPGEPQPKRRAAGKRAATPQEAPQAPSGFDLLPSLREPLEGEIARPAAEASSVPTSGPLLGGHRPAADVPRRGAHSTPPKPTRAGRPAKSRGSVPAASGELWPHATPWSERPIVRHDWGDETGADAGPEPQPDRTGLEAAPVAAPGWEEPVQWPEPAVPEPAADLAAQSAPSPTLPPMAEPPEPQVAAQAPELAPPPAQARRTSWEPAPRPDQPPPWQPIGARWPSRPSETALPPADADVAASLAARSRLDQAADEEAAQVSAMWAESAQRVIDRGSARVCYHCSLPLSTHARYCRRCGTNQQA